MIISKAPIFFIQVCIDGKQLYAASKPFFVPRPKPGDTRPSQQNHTLLGVEGYALEHYLKEKGWPCALHSENSAFSTLFGVLMWDVLFANVADVFRAPFQVREGTFWLCIRPSMLGR